jgi:hypothetical protein
MAINSGKLNSLAADLAAIDAMERCAILRATDNEMDDLKRRFYPARTTNG